MPPLPLPRPRTLRLKFVLYLGSILSLFLGLLFFWAYSQAKQSILDQVDQEARTLLQQVVITRAWIADHGGVFVKKRPGVAENPLLPHSSIVDLKGSTYLLRNPAMVTRELSAYAEAAGLYRFHLSSLKLKNPDNAPLDFEREALVSFERQGYDKSKDGVSLQQRDNGRPFYCRIIPLQVLPACLECHSDQGYQVGEVRGALSVFIPIDTALAAIARSRGIFMAAGLGIVALVLGTVYLLVEHLVLKPVDHLHSVAQQLKDGEYAVKAEVHSGDELETFAQAFNRMTTCLQEGYEGALKSLIAAMDARDSYTKGHTARVAAHATLIARTLGLSEKEVAEVRLGAILHDVGKIGIDDAILRKPTPLEGAEVAHMEAHVTAGAKIVNDAGFLLCALPAILHHHERPDGLGYPEGLRGDSLPLNARIIAVADSYDAMTTDRPYRTKLTRSEALEEIKRQSGSQFDTAVAAAFLAAMEEGAVGRGAESGHRAAG